LDATQWRTHRTSRTTRWLSDVDAVAGRQDAAVVAVVAEMEVAVETAHIGFVVAVVEPLFGC